MNKKIKLLVGSSIVVSSITAGLGLGLGLGLKAGIDSRIYFHLGKENIRTVSPEEIMNIFESNNFSSEYVNVQRNDGDFPDGDLPDGDFPDGEIPDENPEAEDSITSLKARWLTIGFMSASLTGYLDGISDDNITNHEETIFEKYTTKEMIRDGFNDDFEELLKIFIETKLFVETTGSSILFRDYMLTLLESSPELREIVKIFINEGHQTFFDAKEWGTTGGLTYWDELITALSKELEYREEAVDFIYVYSWLWRPYWSSSFDYNLTEILRNVKPSLIWELNLINNRDISLTDRETIEAWKDNPTPNQGVVKQEEWNNLIGKNAGENNIDGDRKSSLKNPDDGDFALGFSGLSFASESVANTDDNLRKYANIFEFNDNEEMDSTFAAKQWENTRNGDLTIYTNMQGETILEPTEESLSGSVVASSLIYPYAFANGWNGTEADSWSYSIAANKENNVYTPITDDDASSITIFNEIGKMFGDDVNNYDVDPQMYILYSIYKNQDSRIIGSTYNYWNNQGYYIELTGKYEDEYGSLIDTRLQKW